MNIAIETVELSRSFQEKGAGAENTFWALRDVSLRVPEGMIFGLLGPNGAGKTTLIKILATLLLPTRGVAKVAGFNVDDEFKKIRPIINMVSGGENCGYGILTVEENLWMFTQFYGIQTSRAMKNIGGLLELMGLAEKAKTKINKLSTGMRQKMNFIRGFITDPRILFLDEPTLGLDVNAARETRKFVCDWVKKSPEPKTVILTTHYMMEADEMCENVAIIDGGKILAVDSPAKLKKEQSDGTVYKIVVAYKKFDEGEFRNFRGVTAFASSPADEDEHLEMIFNISSDSVLPALIEKINSLGLPIKSINKDEFTLEDAFIKLVGKRLTGGEKKDE